MCDRKKIVKCPDKVGLNSKDPKVSLTSQICFYFSVNVTLATTEYTFTRIVGNHFFEIFIPSMMLNLASAASVFIPPHRVPGRMGVCITTFLTLITLFNGARWAVYNLPYINTVFPHIVSALE